MSKASAQRLLSGARTASGQVRVYRAIRQIDGHKLDSLSRAQEKNLRELVVHTGDDGVEAINKIDSDAVDRLLRMRSACGPPLLSGFTRGGESCLDKETLDTFRESLAEELTDSPNIKSNDIERYIGDMMDVKEYADDGKIQNAEDLFDSLRANPSEDELVGTQLEADRAVFYGR